MANLAVFIERCTLTRPKERGALSRLFREADHLGHRMDFIYRTDVPRIPEYDALFIRSFTDPLNSAYVASRTAQMHGMRVIDDPDSILVCCDKVNMYRHLQRRQVPMPDTVFLAEEELTPRRGEELLESLGSPLVLKAPNSSFSKYVDRVTDPDAFVHVGKRFMRRSDRVVAQRFVRSEFDWRVGVLAGQVLFVCRYLIAPTTWKILNYTATGKPVFGGIQGCTLDSVDPKLLDTAVQAALAVGNGIYGVDLKQVGDEYLVIEVNDNPDIYAGDEDQLAPELYERLVRYLAGEWG